MESLKSIVEIYLLGGIGLLSFLALLWSYVQKIRKITPELQEIRKDNEGYKEVVRNNTLATNKLAESTNRVAESMHILNTTTAEYNKKIEKHDAKIENVERAILRCNK